MNGVATSVEIRLKRLEFWNRLLSILLVLMGSAIIVGQTSPGVQTKLIEAEQFIVRDKEGRIVAELGVPRDEHARGVRLVFNNAQGHEYIRIGTDFTESTVWVGHGEPRRGLSLESTKSGEASKSGLYFWERDNDQGLEQNGGKSARMSLELGRGKGGWWQEGAKLQLYEWAGPERTPKWIVISMLGKGNPKLVVQDGARRLWSAP